MDLGTTAAVVGIIAAVVYVAETAYKCGSAILKKSTGSHVWDKVTNLFKKSDSRILTGARSKKIFTKRSRPFSDARGTSFAVPLIARRLATVLANVPHPQRNYRIETNPERTVVYCNGQMLISANAETPDSLKSIHFSH